MDAGIVEGRTSNCFRCGDYDSGRVSTKVLGISGTENRANEIGLEQATLGRYNCCVPVVAKTAWRHCVVNTASMDRQSCLGSLPEQPKPRPLCSLFLSIRHLMPLQPLPGGNSGNSRMVAR
jgi:hypothetical protein